MSYVTNALTTEAVRMRLEILRNYRHSVVRSGEEQLRAAMADYAKQVQLPHELDPA